MVTSGIWRLCGLIFTIALVTAAQAQWTNVGTGIDYQKFTESGPNNVFVARMDRANQSAIIDTCLGLEQIPVGRETVSSMAARTEDTLANWGGEWGKYRNDVVVAVNGSFFNLSDGSIIDGQARTGTYAKRYHNGWNEWFGFSWTLDRDCFIGGCLDHPASGNIVAYPYTGQSQSISGINTARLADQMILYTPDYGTSTGTNIWGAEALIELSQPTTIMPPPGYISGIVRSVVNNQGSTALPFGHVVVSAHGASVAALIAGARVGSEVRISQQVTDSQSNCSTPSGRNWTRTYASLGGYFAFLRNGVVQTATDSMLTSLNPRTAIALNGNYVYFVVCDGRSAQSIGMTMNTLGTFCINRLAATDGLNLDGGGSSTMWVNGAIKNQPSDGSQRTVANGIMMISLVPNGTRSQRFGAGRNVQTNASANLRRGPGSNWDVTATLPVSSVGVVRANATNGVYAKGDFWWNCTFSGREGWVADSLLSNKAAVAEWPVY